MTPLQVRTNRGPVECLVYGEGPAVLALHGAMGGYDQSDLLARALLGAGLGAAGYRVVAVSRPGYLGTPLSLGRSPEEQADLCADVLDELGIATAVVAAVSGGGQCALQFALRHAARCRALILVSACSAPLATRIPLRFHLMTLLARIPALAAALQRKAAADPEGAAARSIPDAALRRRTLDHPEAGPLLRDLLASVGRDLTLRLPGAGNDIRQSRQDFAYPLWRIASPTLAIHGSSDELVPIQSARDLARSVPRARLLEIPDGSHVSLFTHLDLVRSTVSEFLAGCTSPTSPAGSVR
jgi:pimeloyl-ACP methyl ester carboxylesterase